MSIILFAILAALRVSYHDFLAGIGAVTALALFASAVLGMVFALRHRERPRRWLPAGCVLVIVFLGALADSAGHGVRWDWIALEWSLWMICFAVGRLRHWSGGRVLRALKIAFTTLSIGETMPCMVDLVESEVLFSR